MIQGPLEQVTRESLQVLIDARTAESQTLDFKQELPGSTDRDKHHLCADVCALANTRGGDIVYGIKEEDGVANALAGVVGLNQDKEIRRIHEILDRGIKPRVAGLRFVAVDVGDGASVLVLRVPRSWQAPHAVALNESFRFYDRHAKGNRVMDLTQIRTAIMLSENLEDRIRKWRDDRVRAIRDDTGALRLVSKNALVIHLLPLSAFLERRVIDVKRAFDEAGLFNPLTGFEGTPRYNLDGVVWESGYDSSRRTCEAYGQLYRDGRVEVVYGQRVMQTESGFVVYAQAVDAAMLKTVKQCLKGLGELGVEMPMVCSASLIGVRGASWSVNEWRDQQMRNRQAFDRDVIIPPDILIEDFGVEPATALRPLIDVLWNAAGWEGSIYYDENGTWNANGI